MKIYLLVALLAIAISAGCAETVKNADVKDDAASETPSPQEETLPNQILTWLTEKGVLFAFYIIFYTTFPLTWITFIWVCCIACETPPKKVLKRQMAID